MSLEFSKNPSDYFFTAHLTNFLCHKSLYEFDGVFYPTVQLEGNGVNLALTASATSKLELVQTTECFLLKREKEAKIINVSIINVINP